MPIIFDIENDSIAKLAVSKVNRRNAERLLIINKLSVTEIAMVLDLHEDIIWEIKEELEQRNAKKR